MTNPTAPPKHLSAEARKLWRSVLADYGLEKRHEAVLLTALEALDRMRQAQALLKAEGLIVKDRYGTAKSHAGDDADLGECDDYAKAAELLTRLSAEPDRLNDALVARTNAILDEHWSAIEGVAASLVKRLTIDAQTIRSAARVKGVAASS